MLLFCFDSNEIYLLQKCCGIWWYMVVYNFGSRLMFKRAIKFSLCFVVSSVLLFNSSDKSCAILNCVYVKTL